LRLQRCWVFWQGYCTDRYRVLCAELIQKKSFVMSENKKYKITKESDDCGLFRVYKG